MNYLRESIYFTSFNESNLYDTMEKENSNAVVSDYVHNLANGIYKEFESLILHYGENVVKNLMPMVVSCLETLDRIYSEKHNIEVEFELLKEDSGQLMTQYEREKIQRKKTEENLFNCEDNYSEASKKHEEELQKLKSNQKMIEIRFKNSLDQISRFEKREMEKQLEYDKLLSRYHELLRYHKDHIEKSKIHHNEIKNMEKFERLKSNTNERRNSNSETIDDIDIRVDGGFVNQTSLYIELEPQINVNNGPNVIINRDWDFTPSVSDDEDTNHSFTEEISTGTNILPFDDELAGMSNEIENIIKENNDLIATKNALNIVKDDLISKLDEANSEIEILHHENNSLNTMKTSLKLRINNLEVENKSLKQEFILIQNRAKEDGEENIPISQRKRFTRLEMTRVLMERNQYKEKLLEMEEYVKWMKMLKNKKEKKLSIWERFSRLFKTNDPNSSERDIAEINSVDIPRRGSSFIENTESSSNCLALRDPERQQVNGWSLPRNIKVSSTSDLPIPIYCRPLLENQSGLKLISLAEIICAVTINVHEKFNIKNKTFVGSSIFYNNEIMENPPNSETKEIINPEYSSNKLPISNQGNSEPFSDNSESHVWICTSSDNQSQIIIVDANKPADYLDAFIIHNSPVQCLGSVPGASQKDYIHVNVDASSQYTVTEQIHITSQPPDSIFPNFKMKTVDCFQFESSEINEDEPSYLSSKATADLYVNDNSIASNTETNESNSSQPTIWIGCRNGDLFVHPASGNRSLCLHHIRLSDSITNIIYQNSKVFVSLANGSVVIFNRYISNENKILTGQWQMSKYYLLEPENFNYSIRCLESVTLTNKIWMGYKNQITVIDDASLTLTKCFEAHPRSDYAVRQMCCAGDGMWISLRLDTTLRLFHIYNYQHLQDLNVEPHINKLIEPSLLGLSLLRITCLSTSCNRIWIGTNKGIIISTLFLKDSIKENEVDIVNDFNNASDSMENTYLPTFIPYINHEKLQLSYHGHRDAVKFFVTVRCDIQDSNDMAPNIQKQHKIQDIPAKHRFLIMSGGEGYKDFRLNESSLSVSAKFNHQKSTNKSDEIIKNSSHLIVWQLLLKNDL